MGAGQRPFRARYGGLSANGVETILSWRGVFHFKEAKTAETILGCNVGVPSLYT